MEKLSNAGLLVGEVSQWELINLANTVLIPKWFCTMTALNSSEIAIMGGIGETDGETGVLSDVCLFNVDTNSVTQTVKNYSGLLAFQTESNKAVQAGENCVVALVADDYDNSDAKNMVISYTKGTKMIKKVKEI